MECGKQLALMLQKRKSHSKNLSMVNSNSLIYNDKLIIDNKSQLGSTQNTFPVKFKNSFYSKSHFHSKSFPTSQILESFVVSQFNKNRSQLNTPLVNMNLPTKDFKNSNKSSGPIEFNIIKNRNFRKDYNEKKRIKSKILHLMKSKCLFPCGDFMSRIEGFNQKIVNSKNLESNLRIDEIKSLKMNFSKEKESNYFSDFDSFQIENPNHFFKNNFTENELEIIKNDLEYFAVDQRFKSTVSIFKKKTLAQRINDEENSNIKCHLKNSILEIGSSNNLIKNDLEKIELKRKKTKYIGINDKIMCIPKKLKIFENEIGKPIKRKINLFRNSSLNDSGVNFKQIQAKKVQDINKKDEEKSFNILKKKSEEIENYRNLKKLLSDIKNNLKTAQ